MEPDYEEFDQDEPTARARYADGKFVSAQFAHFATEELN